MSPYAHQRRSLNLLSAVLSIVLLILCDFTVHAQIYLGSLSGQVSDSTGATIVGATVTAIDTTTHFSTKAMTNSSGNYSIQFLTPGTYDITVEYIGFQPQTHKGIVLTAGGNVVTDITLKVGSASDMVTVNAVGVDALNTSSADIDVTFTAKEITDLPNIGRVPFELASLSAGTYDGSYMTAKASGGIVPWGNAGTAISASGVGGSHTIITLNGSIDAPRERITGTGGGYGGFVPSPESVQEVKVQLAMYDAEYGNSGGAAINTVLRSGTNDYHGAAYFIGRNTYLNANQSERVPNQNGAINPGAPTPRPNGTWNQPGGVLSGPVTIPHLYNGHDKTYFMVAYERAMLRTYNGASATGLVPTAAEAQGDFSALCPGGFNANGVCNPGGGVQIYDPLTSDASHNRTPFPYNQIPADRISPVGAALLKYFPAPNAVVSNVVNYIAPDPVIRQRYYSFVTRVDHTINENNKLNATFYKSVLNQQYPDMGFPQGIGPTNEGEAVYRNNAGGGLDYVRIFPNDWVLNARIGVLYHPFGVILPGLNIDLASLGINSAGLGYQSFPGLSFSDSYLGLQGATPLVPNTSQATSQISHDTNGSAAAIVSKVIASHSLRFGFEGLLERYNAANPLSGLGTFNFTRQFTQKNSVNTTVGGDASSGNPIASLLLGYPSSGNYSAQVSYAIQQPYAALFIQDNWKARRNLTLNLGLRWDYQAPYTERNNQLNTGFCTTCVNPLQNSVSGLNLLGGLEFISSGSRHYYPSELHDWQPRLGISYAITPRVVFHGGIGLTYINSMESPFGQGFNATTNYIATNDNTTPLTSIANPFPTGTVQPSGSSLGLATLVGQNLNFIAPGYVRPGLLQWSASLQTRLPGNIVLQPAYVANRVYHWEINKDINALPAQYNLGTTDNVTYLQAMVPNPMAGLIPNNATLNARMIQRQNLLKPFPEFGTLTEMYIPAGGSRYDALQVTVTKPLSHGLSVRSSFTMSHQIDSFQYMNPTDSAPEWYKDPNPNRLLTMAIMYSLPGLTATPRFVRSVLGGWQFNSALRRYNGLLVANPANVTQLSDPRISDPTYGRYFNTCYLDATGKMVMTAPNRPACDSTSSIPAFKLNNSFTLNTLGPNMTGVRARGGTRLDASLFKVFKIHEQTTFELRAEFFNALNSPVYGIPNLSPGNAAYGKISLTQQNDPRLGQLTVRINF